MDSAPQTQAEGMGKPPISWRNRIPWAALMIGLILFSGMFWADLLDPLIFDATGEYRTGGIFPLLSPFLLQVSMLLHFGWFYGLPFLLFGSCALTSNYARTNLRFPGLQSRRFGTTALVLAGGAHFLIFLSCVPFFFTPAGAAVRPMGWAFCLYDVCCG
jgi:hypothetical protein